MGNMINGPRFSGSRKIFLGSVATLNNHSCRRKRRSGSVSHSFLNSVPFLGLFFVSATHHLQSDIVVFVPVLNYAHCWSGHTFIYQFNEANTWDGPRKGLTNHILDVANLFQNYNEPLTESQRGGAVQFAKDVIEFANRDAPWAAFKWENGDPNSRVYGGRETGLSRVVVVTVTGPDPRTERADTILGLMASIPADDLARAWGALMAGL